MFQAQTIYRFSLHSNLHRPFDALHIYPWIITAVERNVQELKLNFGTSPGQLVRLPSPIFTCRTLVCLKLFDATFMDVPVNVCLPSLRILQAERVYYPNEGCFIRLLSGSPILEELIIEEVERQGSCSGHQCSITEKNHCEETEFSNWLLQATDQCPNARNDKIVRFNRLLYLHVNLLSTAIPKFCNLVYLEITTCCEFWRELVALLRSANNLKALLFHINVPSYHKGSKCGNSLPVIAPRCVSESLETLKLTGVCKQKCSWKFVQYVLKNAKVLKEMKIGTSLSLKNRSRCLKNLLKYPRASAVCEIDFFIDSSA
ncbi:hypothetical protein V6N13_016253 [Hibiscus sabdariffa]